jgi:hypothetical protein
VQGVGSILLLVDLGEVGMIVEDTVVLHRRNLYLTFSFLYCL